MWLINKISVIRLSGRIVGVSVVAQEDNIKQLTSRSLSFLLRIANDMSGWQRLKFKVVP